MQWTCAHEYSTFANRIFDLKSDRTTLVLALKRESRNNNEKRACTHTHIAWLNCREVEIDENVFYWPFKKSKTAFSLSIFFLDIKMYTHVYPYIWGSSTATLLLLLLLLMNAVVIFNRFRFVLTTCAIVSLQQCECRSRKPSEQRELWKYVYDCHLCQRSTNKSAWMYEC